MDGEIKIEKLKSIAGEEWIMKRRNTTWIFYAQQVALGMEYSLTFVTLYLYLKDVIKTDHVTAYYGAISTIYVVMKICTALLLSPVFDRTRRLRCLMVTGNALITIGNALYTIPLSPWFLFVGRFLSGSVFLRPIMCAEIIRSYTPQESLKSFSVFGITFALGVIMGPACNFFFAHTEFPFLGIQIGYANGSGLFLTFIFLMMSILSMFCVHDLSREFDLKEYLRLNAESFGEEQHSGDSGEKKVDLNTGYLDTTLYLDGKDFNTEEEPSLRSIKFNESNNINSSRALELERVEQDWLDMDGVNANENMLNKTKHRESNPQDHLSCNEKEMEKNSFQVIFKLMSNSDSACILLFSFYFCLCLISADMWIPMMCNNILSWGIVEVNSIILGVGVSVALAMAVVFLKPPSPRNFVYVAMFCVFCLVSVLVIFVTLEFYHKIEALNIVLIILSVIFYAISFVVEPILIQMLAVMVTSQVQAFAESLRLAFTYIGSVAAVASAAFLFEYLAHSCLAFVIGNVIILLIMIVKRKNFQDLAVVI